MRKDHEYHKEYRREWYRIKRGYYTRRGLENPPMPKPPKREPPKIEPPKKIVGKYDHLIEEEFKC